MSRNNPFEKFLDIIHKIASELTTCEIVRLALTCKVIFDNLKSYQFHLYGIEAIRFIKKLEDVRKRPHVTEHIGPITLNLVAVLKINPWMPAQNAKITTIPFLANLQDLCLDQSRVPMCNLCDLARLPKLTKLSLSGMKLFSDDVVIKLNNTNLERLYLRDNDICTQSLSKLGTPNLVFLDVSKTGIGGDANQVNAFVEVTKLRDLRINNTQFTNTNFMTCLLYLTKLEAQYTPIKDVSHMATGTNLQMLSFACIPGGISIPVGLGIISALTEIKELVFSYNNNSDFSELSKLRHLEVLDIQSTLVFSLDFLVYLKNLEKLNLSNTDVVSSDEVNSCERLHEINLSSTNITKIVLRLDLLDSLKISNLSLDEVDLCLPKVKYINIGDTDFNRIGDINKINQYASKCFIDYDSESVRY